MKVQAIPTGALGPNPWNPNQMDAEMFAKLKAYIEREGFVEPLVVRPQGDGYEILGGYHRWQVAQQLGLETVPCVVVKLNDRRAKILSINLNELKGQSAPDLLAELIHDLSHDVSLEDLSTQLPYDLADLRDLTDLLRIPDSLRVEVAEEAEAMDRERVRVLSFPLRPDQLEVVESALDEALKTIEGTSRSAALVQLAKEFTSASEEEAV